MLWLSVSSLSMTVFAAPPDPTAEALAHIATLKVGKFDWPQWGGTPHRNNTPAGKNIATTWDVKTGENILWRSSLGSQTYGNPVVANGKVYVGTNNGGPAYVKRYPQNVDHGCLLCFEEATGKFLWQHSNEKRRVQDWPEQGVCGTVCVDGDRVWYVSNRGCVVCLDANGFHDGKNDGPFVGEPNQNREEADVIWEFDMIARLGVSPHDASVCSVTCVGDTLLVITGNGVDEGHLNIPAPNAPSFIALDRVTGKLRWKDASPGANILHGQWSSPSHGVFGGKPTAIFGGGDGWLYGFDPANGRQLFRFDANPKRSAFVLGARSTRNHIVGTPTVYDGKVYFAVGEDPEHGEAPGHLWCIDPTKRGDISPELVFNRGQPAPRRRVQAAIGNLGDVVKPNPNSALVWHHGAPFREGEARRPADPDDTFHRTIGSATIKNDLLFIADFSGFVHCLDAQTGVLHWRDNMLAASWGTALIVDGKVYFGNEDGDVLVYSLSKEKKLLARVEMGSSIYTSPVAANDTLFIANRSHLFAIKQGAKADSAKLK